MKASNDFRVPLNGAFTFGAKFSDLDDDGFKTLSFQETSDIPNALNAHNGTFSRGFFDIVEDAFDNSKDALLGIGIWTES